MTIWRNLDPKLLADLLIQASESLKARNAARTTRPSAAPAAARTTAGTIGPLEIRRV